MKLAPLILLVAAATYLLRIVPLALLRRPLREPHLVAFIEYLPYTILTAMVLPGIFGSTGDARSSAIGAAAALALALLRRPLPVVAFGAAAAAYAATFLG